VWRRGGCSIETAQHPINIRASPLALDATFVSCCNAIESRRADDRIVFDAEHGFVTPRDADGMRALTQQDA